MDDLQTVAEIMKGPLGDLLHKLAGPLSEEVGESLGVWAKHYRFKTALRMFQKTRRMLAEAGIDPQAVKPRLFLPIIESASVEDDEDMHSRWAALLANAGTGANSVHPSYIEILKQLSPEDARLLDQLCDFCEERRTRKVTAWIGSVTLAEKQQRVASGDNPEIPFNNLVRLGLIQDVYDFNKKKMKVKLIRNRTPEVMGELDTFYVISDIAFALVQACRAPKTINAEQSV